MRTIFKRAVKKENFIMKFIRTQKQKEELKTKKELNFLFQQVFQFYFDTLKPTQAKESEVDLPEFMYDKQRMERAERRAFNELLYRVADKKVVSKLCRKRLNQLKKQGLKITL